jgi:hypothetical protein
MSRVPFFKAGLPDFLVEFTKTGYNIPKLPNGHNTYKMSVNTPNGLKIYQDFQSQGPPKIPKLRILV